ncbi:MAG: TIGR03960 family B12-binding radical SAM protein [Deltaproteobacteria bacterium]|nr:TIGR03960 family B12-binding radical SAM protein [Deltaproteobacteria bacterium]
MEAAPIMAAPRSTRLSDHPYAALLGSVAKPARYTGGEVGSVTKDWSTVQARICLAFPDIYDIGMSHLGYKILYDVLNRDERTLAERVYCPWVDLADQLRAQGLVLVSLESHRPLGDFDVVGFSLQFELTYTNVLTMLELGAIPLRAADRSDDDPLVVAGGPSATHPEPMAPFFDAIVIGDGEAALTELALRWTELKDQGVARTERLGALAKLAGVYVPALYEVEQEPATGLQVVVAPADEALPYPIRRARVAIADYPFPTDSPTGGPEAVFDRTSVEIARGCTEGCRFCQGGMINRPVQEREPRQVCDAVLGAVQASGNDEVSLTALSTADVSYIEPLVRQLGPQLAAARVSLGVSSLRAYGLPPALLGELRRVRAGGLTFAPEAGTQRLRDVVNKNVTDEQLDETTERVFSRGWTKMKLYFMIGLPTEEDDDLRGIVATGARVAGIGRSAARRRVDVTVSVSTHVPKPHTPFQWAAMDRLAEVDRKQQLLATEARAHRQVKLRTHSAVGSMLEGVLARGDRALADVIEHAWRAGARFDSWDEHLDLGRWEAAFDAHGVEPRRYLDELPLDARLPWSHLDVGIDPDFLRREQRRALAGRLSPPCCHPAPPAAGGESAGEGGSAAGKLICYHCGAECDLEELERQRQGFQAQLASPSGEPSPDEASPAGARTAGAGPAAEPHRGHRYRFQFEKTGAAALLGHLDLVRELPRVFRRLGVELIYSRGFHPKPQLTFGPALSLGVASLGEQVELRLDQPVDEAGQQRLVDEMNRVSPAGLRFVTVEAIDSDAPTVSSAITGARYLIAFEQAMVDDAAGAARAEAVRWLASRCEAVLAASELPIRRQAKGKQRTIDARRHLRTLAPAGPEAAQMLGRADIRGDLVCVEAVVAITPTGSVRVAEVAQVLFGGQAVPAHRAVRVALLTDGGSGTGGG